MESGNRHFFVKTLSQVPCHGKSTNSILPQHNSTFGCWFRKTIPLIKNLLDSEIHSAPLARKAKILFKKLGKINSETKFPENGSELQNSFFGNTFQEVFPVAQESTMKKEL